MEKNICTSRITRVRKYEVMKYIVIFTLLNFSAHKVILLIM